MKRLLLIVGALSVMLTAAVVGIGYYVTDEREKEKNAKRTEPARKARWPEKEAEVKPIEETKPQGDETKDTPNL
jgi:flagellar basal body-associated protein FliL